MKLVERYTSCRPKSAHDPGGVWRDDARKDCAEQHPDVLAMWARRTMLYAPPVSRDDRQSPSEATATDNDASKDTAAISPGASASTIRPERAMPSAGLPTSSRAAKGDVPKSLGFAKCSGCGAAKWHKADGAALQSCPRCHRVWYCSDLCARLDAPSHRADCAWHTCGANAAFAGSRTTEEHWVVSGTGS
jgi:hypothetical protein